MSAYTILEEAAEKQGWNTDTQLELLLEYIDEYRFDVGFKVFIEERVRNEQDLERMDDEGP